MRKPEPAAIAAAVDDAVKTVAAVPRRAAGVLAGAVISPVPGALVAVGVLVRRQVAVFCLADRARRPLRAGRRAARAGLGFAFRIAAALPLAGHAVRAIAVGLPRAIVSRRIAHGYRDRIAHLAAVVALHIVPRGLGAGGGAGQLAGRLVREAVLKVAVFFMANITHRPLRAGRRTAGTRDVRLGIGTA